MNTKATKLTARGVSSEIRKTLTSSGYNVGTMLKPSDYNVAAKVKGEEMFVTIEWQDGDSEAIILDTLEYCKLYDEYRDKIKIELKHKKSNQAQELSLKNIAAAIKKHLKAKGLDANDFSLRANQIDKELVLKWYVPTLNSTQMDAYLNECEEVKTNRDSFKLIFEYNPIIPGKKKAAITLQICRDKLVQFLRTKHENSQFQTTICNAEGIGRIIEIEWFDELPFHQVQVSLNAFLKNEEYGEFKGKIVLKKFHSEQFVEAFKKWADNTDCFWWDALEFKTTPNQYLVDSVKCPLDIKINTDRLSDTQIDFWQTIFNGENGGLKLEHAFELVEQSVVKLIRFTDLTKIKNSSVSDPDILALITDIPRKVADEFWNIEPNHSKEEIDINLKEEDIAPKTEKKHEYPDFGEMLEKTTQELKRIGGGVEHWREYLIKTYDKKSRNLLSDEQLWEFYCYLRKLEPLAGKNTEKEAKDFNRNMWSQELHSFGKLTRKVLANHFNVDISENLSGLVDLMVDLEKEYTDTLQSKKNAHSEQKPSESEKPAKELTIENGEIKVKRDLPSEQSLSPQTTPKFKPDYSNYDFKNSKGSMVIIEYGEGNLDSMLLKDNNDLVTIFTKMSEKLIDHIWSDFRYLDSSHINALAYHLDCDLTEDLDIQIATKIAQKYVLDAIKNAVHKDKLEVDYHVLEGYCDGKILNTVFPQ